MTEGNAVSMPVNVARPCPQPLPVRQLSFHELYAQILENGSLFESKCEMWRAYDQIVIGVALVDIFNSHT